MQTEYINIDRVLMSLIKGDSLLSSISNISVLIKPGDGSSIFNFSMVKNNYEANLSEPLCQIKIDDIFPQSHLQHNNESMLDKIIKKEDRESSIIHYTTAPILPQVTYSSTFNEKSWMITQQKGVSQDQNSQDEEEKEEINEKRIKNQTKNIPKNYGKAIISFIEKYKTAVNQICTFTGVPFEDFYSDMTEAKKTINTIADLRRLWIDYKYAKCMRIISNLFLRKYSLSYIFNSRICNFKSHIKYRHRICEAIKNPHAFRHIKDY